MSTIKETSIQIELVVQQKIDYNTKQIIKEKTETVISPDPTSVGTTRQETLTALRDLKAKVNARFDALIEQEDDEAEAAEAAAINS